MELDQLVKADEKLLTWAFCNSEWLFILCNISANSYKAFSAASVMAFHTRSCSTSNSFHFISKYSFEYMPGHCDWCLNVI
jgi:hypothetical protein